MIWLTRLFRLLWPQAAEVTVNTRDRFSNLDAQAEDANRRAAQESFQETLLRVARGEIGNGEEGANNRGPHIKKYRAGHGGKGSWCAAFVSWCIEQAAAEAGHPAPVARSHGAKKLFRNAEKTGTRLERPEPGCLVLWSRGEPGGWQGHIGIVHRVDPNGTFYSIEGNRGRYPSYVASFPHFPGERRLLGFVRIGR